MAKAITEDTTFDPLHRHSNGRGHTKKSKYDSYVMASPIRMAMQRVKNCILCYGLRHSSGDTKGGHTHTHTHSHTQHVHACSNIHMLHASLSTSIADALKDALSFQPRRPLKCSELRWSSQPLKAPWRCINFRCWERLSICSRKLRAHQTCPQALPACNQGRLFGKPQFSRPQAKEYGK